MSSITEIEGGSPPRGQYSDLFLLFIFYPVVSLVPLMPSPAIRDENVGVWGVLWQMSYIHSSGREESTYTNVVIIGHVEVSKYLP